MNKSIFFGIILGFFVLHLPLAHALDKEDRVRFSGEIIDGPFKGKTIKGYCDRDPLGDKLKQKTRCVINMTGGYKIVDPQASIEIIAGRAMRIILGLNIVTADKKGNFKISAFEVTTFFDEDITLFSAVPRRYLAVVMSIGGVSVADGEDVVHPECLIWDVVGGSM